MADSPQNQDNTISTLATMSTTTRKLLKWELRWIPAELVMIVFGLFLALVLDAGSYFLFLACALSFVVRITHYCSIGRRQADNVV